MSSLFPPVLDVPFAWGPSCLPIKLKHTHTIPHSLHPLPVSPPRVLPCSFLAVFFFFLSVGLCFLFFFSFFFSFSHLCSLPQTDTLTYCFQFTEGSSPEENLGVEQTQQQAPPPSIKHGTSNTMMTSDGGDKHSVDVWVRTAVNKQMMNPVITALGSPLCFPRPSPSLISVSLFSRPPLFSRHVPSPSPPRSFWSPRGT